MLPTAGAYDGEARIMFELRGSQACKRSVFASLASSTAFHGPPDGWEVVLGIYLSHQTSVASGKSKSSCAPMCLHGGRVGISFLGKSTGKGLKATLRQGVVATHL